MRVRGEVSGADGRKVGRTHEVDVVLYFVRVPSKLLLVETCSRDMGGELGERLGRSREVGEGREASRRCSLPPLLSALFAQLCAKSIKSEYFQRSSIAHLIPLPLARLPTFIRSTHHLALVPRSAQPLISSRTAQARE